MVDGVYGNHGVGVLYHVTQGWNLEIERALTQNQARGETIASETLRNTAYATSLYVQVLIFFIIIFAKRLLVRRTYHCASVRLVRYSSFVGALLSHVRPMRSHLSRMGQWDLKCLTKNQKH